MTNELVRPDERIDEFSGLKVIQKIHGPRFSIDAILLARFCTVKKGDLVADLGTGTGIIPLLLASNTKAEQIVGIEIQEELADLARRNVALNGLEDRIRILQGDLRVLSETHPPGQFNLVLSNPPYRLLGAGQINPNLLKAISRHEIKCTLEDVLEASFYLLRNRGRFALVYHPDRMVDLISGCRQHRLEPKRLQFLHPDDGGEASLILLEASKNGHKGLKVLDRVTFSIRVTSDE